MTTPVACQPRASGRPRWSSLWRNRKPQVVLAEGQGLRINGRHGGGDPSSEDRGRADRGGDRSPQ